MMPDERIGTGAIPYEPGVGGGGELPSGFFERDTLARERVREVPDEVVQQILEAAGEPQVKPAAVEQSDRERMLSAINRKIKGGQTSGSAEMHRADLPGPEVPAGREPASGPAHGDTRGERVLDVLVPVQPRKRPGGPRKVSRDASHDQAQVQEARPEPAQPVRPVGLVPYTISLEYFHQAVLEEATAHYNALYDKTVEIGKLLQRRRDSQTVNSCSFCKTAFTPHNPHYGRFPYQDPPGSGVFAYVYCCRNGNCIKAYEDAINEIAMRLKGVAR